MKGLRGKNVLVTGGTSGIGQAAAIRFAEEGAHIALNYLLSIEEAEETEQQIEACRKKVRAHGVKDALVKGDVSQKADVDSMFKEAIAQLGGIDILVNNAGIQKSCPTNTVDLEDVTCVLDVNLRGAFLCAQHAIRHFLDAGKPGAIINVSSVHQMIPKPRYIGYSMSKGGMRNLTETLALEFAGRNIRVNAVAPGATVTPINRSWVDDPEKKDQVDRHIPMGRPADADEVAAIIAFLASEEAAYIIGQTIYIDGGLTLYADFRTPWSSE